MTHERAATNGVVFYGSIVAALVLTVLFAPFVAVVAVPEAVAYLFGRSLLQSMPAESRLRVFLRGPFIIFRWFGMLVLLIALVYLTGWAVFAVIGLGVREGDVVRPTPILNMPDGPTGGLLLLLGIGVISFGVLVAVFRYVLD
jgi:hypothetical protein